jgi:hypothetical protein
MKQRVKRHTPASSDDPSYRNLPLTRGLDAKVPTELFDDLDNRWNWQAHSSRGILYARRWRQKSDGPGPFNIALHDVIYELLVGLIPAGLTVDFVNRNTLDCRKINLRLATRQEQNWNVDIKSSNTSGFIGVVWHTRKRKWSARVGTKGKKTPPWRF